MAEARKTVLITGCSPGGIGHSLAKQFHSHGLRVFATARSTSTISDLEALGITALALEVDKPDSIRAAKAQVTELTGGKLDFLVNNAGRNYTVPALDVDFDEVRQTFEVNVFAVMRMCQEFAPLLIEARGCIVQIGSLAGVMPYVFGSGYSQLSSLESLEAKAYIIAGVYNASKAALHAYSNTLRVELAPFGVRVVTIVTGGIKSNIARTERELPEGSLYIPLTEEYQRRLKHSQEGAMPNDAYARSVVGKVLQKNPPKWVWEGNKSWLVWFLDSFLPNGIMDIVFWRMFHLWKLARPSDAKKDL